MAESKVFDIRFGFSMSKSPRGQVLSRLRWIGDGFIRVDFSKKVIFNLIMGLNSNGNSLQLVLIFVKNKWFLKCWFSFGGPEGFRKVREADKMNFLQMSLKSNFMVPSYDQKT